MEPVLIPFCQILVVFSNSRNFFKTHNHIVPSIAAIAGATYYISYVRMFIKYYRKNVSVLWNGRAKKIGSIEYFSSCLAKKPGRPASVPFHTSYTSIDVCYLLVAFYAWPGFIISLCNQYARMNAIGVRVAECNTFDWCDSSLAEPFSNMSTFGTSICLCK